MKKEKIAEDSSDTDVECILASDSDESLDNCQKMNGDDDDWWIINIKKKIRLEDLTKGRYVLCVFNQKIYEKKIRIIFCWFSVTRRRWGW